MHVRSWRDGYRGLIEGGVLDRLDPASFAARYRFGGGPPVTVVAEEDGTIVGFVTYRAGRETAPSVGALEALYVAPDVWGRGVGRALVAHARGQMAAGGCTRAGLWVLVGNRRAERFYRADGWVPDGRTRSGRVHQVAVEEMAFTRALP